MIGALPSASNVAQRRVSDSLHDGDIYNNFTESIDALRALILHNANVEPTRVLLVTSAVSGEGKTTLASHLAASLARAGRKTLLVDGDLRRPAAHVQFDLPLGPGLSEVIRGEVEVDEVIRQTAAPDLSMITAGKADREVLQALARGGLGKTFDMLRMHFDFVILDSSPVLPVSDALLLGQQADAVLFSIRRGVSQVPKAQAACEKLASVGVRVLGAVINGEDQVTPGCYSSPTGAYPTTSRSRKLEEANAA